MAAVLVLCAATAIGAAGARFWQVATQAEFLKGDVESLSIDQHGRLVLGPDTTLVADTTAPFLWTVVPAPGGGVFVGTGNDGQVFRVAPDGTRSVYFDTQELEAHAIAPGPDGALYVATSPEGRIYRVDAAGKGTVFFDPEDKYIWALAVDARGTVYAATGDKGLVYRIPPDGKGEVFYRTRATHVRTLALGPSGALFAGTESPGRVFRIQPDGAGFVLLDTGLQEVSALRFDDKGTLYATALSGKTDTPAPERAQPEPAAQPVPVPTVSTEITSIAILDVPPASAQGGAQAAREERRGSTRGAVYRVTADGESELVWETADDAPYDVLPEGGGTLLVATGTKGKIYRVAADSGRITLVTSVDAQQVTQFHRDARGQAWFTTANPGKLFRLSSGTATRGTYESEVRDAQTVATWGAISWRGATPAGTGVRLFTRSGNTAVPDETWSRWSGAYTKQLGETISSPRARYLQWKLELTGTASATPIVTSVTVAYLQRNLRPEVTGITVHPPGVVFQKPFSSGEAEIAGYDGATPERRASAAPPGPAAQPALGRRAYQKGLQTFAWKAEDGNDDDLQFDVLYRREGETAWKALKRGLSEPLYVWDTTSVPNGTYVVKIIATDAPGNPPGAALSGERESRSLDVDNAPPTIAVTGVRRDGARSIVSFTVKDDHSPLQRVEYSVDADRWRPIYPKDGIADSLSEEFELVVEGDASEKAVVMRAVDAMNNVATARAEAPAR